MQLIVQKEICRDFKPVIGVIAAHDIDNGGNSEEIRAMLRDEEENAKTKFSGEGSLGQHPFISAWRRAYKQFGADPHQYRCSAEALARRAAKGDMIPHINALVDIYNLISLRYVIPVGGEDMEMIAGDLHLCYAQGDEQFVRIGSQENESPASGEVVYRDEKGVVCRRWNWREADRTKLTEETRNAVIFIDGLAEISKDAVEQATRDLASLVAKYCGGHQAVDILNDEHAEMMLADL